MKWNNLAVAKTLVLCLAVLMATAAFASNKGSFRVEEAVLVNGQQIPAGDYKLVWEGTGTNVEVSFMQGRKEVAKTSARIIELNQPSTDDAALVDRSSGKATVSEIHFAGKKDALVLGGSETASMK
jgi:predicted lysophospholipase L1 biosynthesis ABC-type transport system permease subunit